MGTVDVLPVRTRRQYSRFVRLPWRLYAESSPWIPPLLREEFRRLNLRHNPFFKNGDIAPFLARRGGSDVGRVAAIVNRAHNRFHRDRIGFFGFFECVNDRAIARQLVQQAERWLRRRGCSSIRGPMNPSINDTCGILVEGFEDPPCVLMPYNPPFYDDVLTGAGLVKAMDLLAFEFRTSNGIPQRYRRIADRLSGQTGYRIRRIEVKRLREEVAVIGDIFNDAWAENWGFVPLEASDLDYLAKGLRPLLDPNLVLFVEIDERPVGFSIMIPDINPLLKKMNGRLLPLGVIHFMCGLRRLRTSRMITLGVRRSFQRRGIESWLIHESIQRGVNRGIERGELSWILETNRPMINSLERLGARSAKRYRIYEKPLAQPTLEGT